ncbi:esterase-like activity of phytase family protein [Phycisphaerales bacterium ac7]
MSQIIYKYIGVLSAVVIGLVNGACSSPGANPFDGPVAIELLGVAEVSRTHPMTGNPVGGFSDIAYDPVARAWLVVSNRQPDPVAYTLRTSFDPRPESGSDAWVAGSFDAWLGREWPVPGDAEDAEAVTIRRSAAASHQRVWALEREPTVLLENLRSDTARDLALPADVRAHYRFDDAIKALAIVPARAGDELWGAMSSPLSVDELGAPGLTRVLVWRVEYEEPVRTRFYAPDRYGVDGEDFGAVVGLSTVPGADWRDDLPVFAIERSTGSAQIARLFLIDGEERRSELQYPLLTKRAIGTLSDLVDGPFGRASGLAIGPEIADLRGGRLVLVTVNDGFASDGKAQRVYAFRVQTDAD